jgi:hypothetical protein
MALVIRKFSGLSDLNAFVTGRLRGSVDLTKTHSSLYLHNLTLVFTTPAATVTFAASPAATQVPLTLAQIKAQIEAQAAGVLVSWVNGYLELRASPAGTLVLGAGGTSKPLFGLPAAATTVTPLNPPGGAAPTFISVGPEGSQSNYLLTYNDA